MATATQPKPNKEKQVEKQEGAFKDELKINERKEKDVGVDVFNAP